MITNKTRCSWCEKDSDMMRYHDEEWGVLVKDDHKLFEFLMLECAQAGLSWQTILKRREGYRKAFANFDVHKVAKFTQKKRKVVYSPKKGTLLKDPSLISPGDWLTMSTILLETWSTVPFLFAGRIRQIY